MKKFPLNRIIIPVSFCLLLLFCRWIPKKVVENYRYRGNISIEIYLDNVLKAKIGHVMVYDQYLFESVETIHFLTDTQLNKEGEVINEKSIEPYSTLDSFLLTNFQTKTCFSFGIDSIKPVLRSRIPVRQKKAGLQLRDNLEDLAPYINGVNFMKDTLIKGNKFKLLVSDQSNNPDNKGIKKIVFYLNSDMIDFPFHPMSKVLDEKFGGIILKFSYITTNGRIQDMVYNYTDGLSEVDTRKIKRFIKTTGSD